MGDVWLAAHTTGFPRVQWTVPVRICDQMWMIGDPIAVPVRIEGNMTILHPALRTLPDIEPPPWREDSACREESSRASFFPGGDRGKTLTMATEAKRVCRGCPVKIDCLLYAIETQQEYGVWGGATVPERRKLIRRLRTANSTAAVLEILAAGA